MPRVVAIGDCTLGLPLQLTPKVQRPICLSGGSSSTCEASAEGKQSRNRSRRRKEAAQAPSGRSRSQNLRHAHQRQDRRVDLRSACRISTGKEKDNHRCQVALEEVPGAVLRTNEGGRYHRHDASATPRNEKKKVQRARQSTGELAVLKRAFNLGLTWTPPKVRTVPAMKMYKESTPRKGFLTDHQYTQLARECNREGLWHL